MMATVALLATAAIVAAADTVKYVVLNHGRPAGEMTVVHEGDSVVVRYRHIDRNRGVRSQGVYRRARDGSVVFGESRNVGLNDGIVGPRTDQFEVVRDSIRWGIPSSGGARRDSGYFRLRFGTAYDQALLARYLLKRPDRTTGLLPVGTARLEIAGDTAVRGKAGRQRVRMAVIHGAAGTTPGLIWLDERNDLFASAVGWFITVREGWEDALPALRAKEIVYRDSAGEALARRVMPPPVSAVAIVNGDVFDAETGTIKPRQTVIIKGDRIQSVAPSDLAQIPAGSTIIDAAGKTIVPGLWEMHGHTQLTWQTTGAFQQLSQGITTVRDLASDIDVVTSTRDRIRRGALLGPNLVLAGFLEGPGLWAGPSAVIVRTEDEARRWVARYDSLGYRQVKLYNMVHPDLVPTIVAEAHKRGMRVSGHVPRGLSTQTAVRLGYDEINHAAFLFSTFYPDSLYWPAMRPYSAVALAVAPNINVDSPEMTDMITLFREKGTVIDGTFAVWVQPPGAALQPAGLTQSTDTAAVTRANTNWVRLLKRLYDAGVTIVPGTDVQGSTTYMNELELYERAGMPAAAVLQSATIVSARVMQADRDYGSIAAGKVADLVIVDGRPAQSIADLRKVHRIVRAGRVYDPSELRKAIGLAPR